MGWLTFCVHRAWEHSLTPALQLVRHRQIRGPGRRIWLLYKAAQRWERHCRQGLLCALLNRSLHFPCVGPEVFKVAKCCWRLGIVLVCACIYLEAIITTVTT